MLKEVGISVILSLPAATGLAGSKAGARTQTSRLTDKSSFFRVTLLATFCPQLLEPLTFFLQEGKGCSLI